MIMKETRKGSILSKVLQYTKEGWPGKPEPELLPYYNKQLELSYEDTILLWDSRPGSNI